MLDEFRPRLLPTAQLRRRSDATDGIYDVETGHAFETAPDQSNLVELFDGKRTMLEVSAEYLNKHGFVPFAAMNDLVRALAKAHLLANPPEELDRLGLADQGSWTDLFVPWVLWRPRAFLPAALRAIEVVGWIALAWWMATKPAMPLYGYDVPLVYVGAAIALTLRGRFKGAACALFGFPPKRAIVALTGGVLHIVPDPALPALLDRRPRALAYLMALGGVLCAVAICTPRPGLWAGAFIVLVIECCPFIASSFGKLIAALAGRVDLREHVRAYIGRPMVKNMLSLRFPRGDRDLFVSALLSVGWVVLVGYLMVTRGLGSAVRLIDVGIAGQGLPAALAYVGAGILFTIMPLLLLMLVGKVLEAVFAVAWTPGGAGRRTGGAADLSAFRSIPLFSKLSEEDLTALSQHSKLVTYDSGETIVAEGSKGDTFFSVRSGVVMVERELAPGQPRPVARLGVGDCFGETALIKDGVRSATVRAVTETVVIELAREAFEKVAAHVGGLNFVSVLRAATAVGESRLFKEMPAERRFALAMKFVPKTMSAGTDVVRAGDPGDEFYLVGKGNLEVLTPDGKKVAQLGAGDVFGEIALLRNVPRTATVRTVTDSVLLALSRDVFLQALNADMGLSARVEQVAQSRMVVPGPATVPPPPAKEKSA